MSESLNIVLVGAGSGGFQVFRQLSAKLDLKMNYNLIVIEPRKFFVHQPSTIRMVVTPEGGYENRSIMDHPSDLSSGNTRFIYAKVTSIVDKEGNGGHVILDNGDTIDFSILILATGSRFPGPFAFSDTKDEILESVSSWRKGFKEAQDVVIVGGGAVGFEVSGEIKDEWPDKRVTIVHGQALPLNDAYPDRWRKKVAQNARKRNISLVFSDHVTNIEPQNGNIITRGGKTIPADLVVPAYGARPNTEFIKSLADGVLTDKGLVKVEPTFQLVDYPRIFALGDIIDWKEQKQAAKLMGHVPLVVNNVMSLVDGKSASFQQYKGSSEMIAVTNGKNGGSMYIGILWGIILGDWVTSVVKGKTLMVEMTKKSMGL